MVGKATKGSHGRDEVDPRIPTAPDNLDLIIWNPIYEGMATLWEMKNCYSISDCLLMNDAITYKADAQRVYNEIEAKRAKAEHG